MSVDARDSMREEKADSNRSKPISEQACRTEYKCCFEGDHTICQHGDVDARRCVEPKDFFGLTANLHLGSQSNFSKQANCFVRLRYGYRLSKIPLSKSC